MQPITRNDLKTRMDRGEDFVLVEVLPEDSFNEYHLPGAINVPVSNGFERRIERAIPDKGTSVVVYCRDLACEASPKAAKTMERLGYEQVYDYEAGKIDWKQAGLPIEN